MSDPARQPSERPAIEPAHACRICGQAVAKDAPAYPFCSPRCRQVDLGRWATGAYKVSREIVQEDLEEGRK